MRITPDEFKDALLKQMKNYDYNIKWDMSEASRKRTREGARLLRKNHATEGATGDYNTGWKTKKTATGNVIYNKDRGYITHLLEKGHNKVNDKGWVHGTPHIVYVEEYVIDRFKDDVEDILKSYGRSR